MEVPARTYQPIENYGIVGDLYTAALVGMDGSIDFLSFPHFDSPTVFAALLDHRHGGRFQIAPTLGKARQKQLYLPNSNILLTRFLSSDGVAEISDFMPVEAVGAAHSLIRRVKTVRGEVCFRMVCAPRFDYGRIPHRVECQDKEVLFIAKGTGHLALRLRTPVPLRMVQGAAWAEFTLRANEHATFVLEQACPGETSPSTAPDYVSRAFKDTVNFWRQWVNRSTYGGRWREMVNRSALTLKLLVSQPHGSIVAAPTFGLPQVIGSTRNWDYRCTWIRDASFTLYALIRLGYTEEASAFLKWIEARCAEIDAEGSLQAVYGIDGRHDLSEETLSHMEGYHQSRPVRVGNNAYKQLQLDIYGELMDAVYLSNKYGEPISYDLWTNLTRLLNWVCDHWQLPDVGAWRLQQNQHAFLYSRVMCWVAIDRGLRLAQKRAFPVPSHQWHKVRDEIFYDVFTNFWNRRQQAFVQHKGATTPDATGLLLPLVKFVSPHEPRWLATLNAIEATLINDTLVYRATEEGKDGLAGKQDSLSMASFWYIESLARAGDLEQARFAFEKSLGYANHLGLYAEVLGARGEHLGNFPHALTHLALISAAYDLDRRLTAAGQTG